MAEDVLTGHRDVTVGIYTFETLHTDIQRPDVLINATSVALLPQDPVLVFFPKILYRCSGIYDGHDGGVCSHL